MIVVLNTRSVGVSVNIIYFNRLFFVVIGVLLILILQRAPFSTLLVGTIIRDIIINRFDASGKPTTYGGTECVRGVKASPNPPLHWKYVTVL